MTTPIAAMVEAMFAAGAPQEAILVAIRTAEVLAFSHVQGQSTDVLAERRERDRLRKQKEREEARQMREAAKANDVVTASVSSSDTSLDTAELRCDSFLPRKDSLLLETKERVSQGSKKELVERGGKRGTRLPADWRPSDADREFARALGFTDAAIATAASEFVDYWIGVPGQRGTKLDWPATFRNRLRALKPQAHRQQNGRSLLEAADRLIDKFGGRAAADAYVPGSAGPGSTLCLDFENGAAGVRKLPPR